MKILLVILHANSSRGGAELYTVTLYRKLLEQGHHVKLAAVTFEPSIEADRRVSLAQDGGHRYQRYLSFLNLLRAHLKSEPYDIVHAMLPVPCDVYHPHAGLEAIGWKSVSRLQRFTNKRRGAFVKMEQVLLGAERKGTPITLCLSDRARAEAIAIYPRVADRIVTLYSGVDDARFLPNQRAPTQPATDNAATCLFIGQDFCRKGLDIAIRAVAASSAFCPTLQLRVVGKDDPGKYVALAKRLKIADRVRFVGASNDIASELAEGTLLIHPARQEPFGMVIPEAMLMGVPPIVSANAGASEIVRDGIDGRIVHGEKSGDWAKAIEAVLADRDRYSAACLARREELSYSRHLSTLLGIYERIIRERSN